MTPVVRLPLLRQLVASFRSVSGCSVESGAAHCGTPWTHHEFKPHARPWRGQSPPVKAPGPWRPQHQSFRVAPTCSCTVTAHAPSIPPRHPTTRCPNVWLAGWSLHNSCSQRAAASTPRGSIRTVTSRCRPPWETSLRGHHPPATQPGLGPRTATCRTVRLTHSGSGGRLMRRGMLVRPIFTRTSAICRRGRPLGPRGTPKPWQDRQLGRSRRAGTRRKRRWHRCGPAPAYPSTSSI